MVHVLNTPSTPPKEPHAIELFPHDSPQVTLVPSKKTKIFSVAKGWVPGIYNTWDECAVQTQGYPDTKYRSFSTRGKAETYLLSMTNADFRPTVVQKLPIQISDIPDLDGAQQTVANNLSDLASGAFNIRASCKQKLEHMESEFASRLKEHHLSYEKSITTSIEQAEVHQNKCAQLIGTLDQHNRQFSKATGDADSNLKKHTTYWKDHITQMALNLEHKHKTTCNQNLGEDLASLRTVVKDATASIASNHQKCLDSINDTSDENIEHIISTVEENLSEFSASAKYYTSKISEVTNGGTPYEALIKTTKADLSTIVERHVQSIQQASEIAQQKLQIFNTGQVDSESIATQKYVEAHSNVTRIISESKTVKKDIMDATQRYLNAQVEAAQVHHDTQRLLTDLKSLQEATKRETNAMTLMKIEIENDKIVLDKLKNEIHASITEWKLLDKHVPSSDNQTSTGGDTFGTTYVNLNDTKPASPYHHGPTWGKGFRHHMKQIPESTQHSGYMMNQGTEPVFKQTSTSPFHQGHQSSHQPFHQQEQSSFTMNHPTTPRYHQGSNQTFQRHHNQNHYNRPNQFSDQSHEQNGGANNYDLYSMRKYVKVKFSSKETLFHSYNIFLKQCVPFGVYLNPLTVITHDENTMCPSVVNGEPITPERKSEMSMAIYNHLFDDKFVPHSYMEARAALKRTTSTLDGYRVLFQMLESIHPRIGSCDYTNSAPLFDDCEDLDDFTNQYENFFVYESLDNRKYTDRNKLNMFLQSLDSTYEVARTRINAILDTNRSSPSVPPELELSRISVTILKYMTDAGIVSHQINRYTDNRSKPDKPFEGNSDNYKKPSQPFYSAKQDVTCKSCGLYGHGDDTCDITAKHICVQNWLEKASDDTKLKQVTRYKKKQRDQRDKSITQTIKALSISRNPDLSTDAAKSAESHLIQLLTKNRHSSSCSDSDTDSVESEE